MTGYHLEHRELERLQAGELSQAETTEVIHHLIHCARCRQMLGQVSSEVVTLLQALLHDLARAGVLSDEGPSIPPRVQARVETVLRNREALREISQDSEMPKANPEELGAELLALDAETRRRAIRENPAYRRFDLVEELLDRSWLARSEDPLASEQLGFDALSILEQFDDSAGDHERLSDLKARAWTNIANARRIRFDVTESKEAFDKAEEWLAQGTRDPRRRAELLAVKCSLLQEQHRFEEAEKLSDQAIAIHRWSRNREGECNCLITKANLHEIRGDLEGAIGILEEAEALLDPSFDPYLRMCVRLNRVYYLSIAGEAEAARALMPEARELARKVGKRLDRTRLRWTEARIALGMGQTVQAEALLREVRDVFLEEEMGYDAALVALELATLLLGQNRVAETKDLAREMLRIFESLDIRREAFAALIMFHKAALQEQATVEMARDLVSSLQHVSVNPALRYENPS
jgi:tetratricopeptide (TPR) repeat protein